MGFLMCRLSMISLYPMLRAAQQEGQGRHVGIVEEVRYGLETSELSKVEEMPRI